MTQIFGAGRPLQELFFCSPITMEHTSSSAPELRLVLELVFVCVTLPCSALCVHQLGVAHQSSLRSLTTMMSFSISLSREAGSLINQPVTSHHTRESATTDCSVGRTPHSLLGPSRGR